VPNPALRYSPRYKKLFSYSLAIASSGRFALPEKNSFCCLRAAATIRGEMTDVVYLNMFLKARKLISF